MFFILAFLLLCVLIHLEFKNHSEMAQSDIQIISHIDLPVELSTTDAFILSKINTYMYEQLSNYSFEDLPGYSIVAEKILVDHIDLKKDSLSYELEIAFELTRTEGLVKAAKLTLNLKAVVQTSISIEDMTKVNFQNKVLNVNILNTSKIQWGFLSLSPSKLLNYFVKKQIPRIESSLDHKMKSVARESFAVDKLTAELNEMDYFKNLGLKCFVEIRNLHFDVLESTEDKINVTARVEAGIVLDDLPQESHLDRVSQNAESGSTNSLFIVSEVFLNRFILVGLDGKCIELDKYSIELRNTSVSIVENTLTIYSVLSGDFNGVVEISGKPVVDIHASILKLDINEIKIETSNILTKALVSLLKKRIQTEIQKVFKLNWNEQLPLINRLVNTQLKLEDRFGLESKILIKRLDIYNLVCLQGRLEIKFGISPILHIYSKPGVEN